MRNDDERGPDRAAPAEADSRDVEASDRRDFLVKLAMGGGVAAAYSVLAVEGLLFLVPPRTEVPTRPVFIGRLDDFPPGEVETVHDLEGKAILIRRTPEGLVAFSSVCPHLGCQVHWEEDEERFFCPCHRGIFDHQGVAYEGPPADAGQSLARVSVAVEGGVVYLEVPAEKKKGGAA